MAIRLRKIEGRWIAVCAACTVVKDGDVYIDDGQHEATARLVEAEESNNPAREWWDRTYGDNGQVAPAGHLKSA
jgi:uncharacterized protein with PhoU and TrkA domain